MSRRRLRGSGRSSTGPRIRRRPSCSRPSACRVGGRQSYVARAHCAAALAGYTARGDRLGISKSLNNMAEFAIDENDLDEAAALTRRAFNLRTILGDVDGQLLTLANLSEIEMHRHVPRAAAEAAERALVLAEDRLDARPAFTVARTLVAARLALGDETGAAEAARLCLKIGTHQRAPELPGLMVDLKAVAFPKPATPTAAEPGSALDDKLAEANRLARLGDVDATTRADESVRLPRPRHAGTWLARGDPRNRPSECATTRRGRAGIRAAAELARQAISSRPPRRSSSAPSACGYSDASRSRKPPFAPPSRRPLPSRPASSSPSRSRTRSTRNLQSRRIRRRRSSARYASC